MRTYFGPIALLLVLTACSESPVAPTTPRPLGLRGQFVITGPNQLTVFSACLNGRIVGVISGSDHADTTSGTMTFPVGDITASGTAATLEPGTHELVVVVSRSTNGPAISVTSGVTGASHITVIDRTTNETIDEEAMEPFQIALSNYEGLRWMMNVDKSGRVQSITPSKATAQEVSQRQSACVARFAGTPPLVH
jgi:hypothetical protein